MYCKRKEIYIFVSDMSSSMLYIIIKVMKCQMTLLDNSLMGHLDRLPLGLHMDFRVNKGLKNLKFYCIISPRHLRELATRTNSRSYEVYASSNELSATCGLVVLIAALSRRIDAVCDTCLSLIQPVLSSAIAPTL